MNEIGEEEDDEKWKEEEVDEKFKKEEEKMEKKRWKKMWRCLDEERKEEVGEEVEEEEVLWWNVRKEKADKKGESFTLAWRRNIEDHHILTSLLWVACVEEKKDYSMIDLLFHGRQCLCRLYYYYHYQGMGFFFLSMSPWIVQSNKTWNSFYFSLWCLQKKRRWRSYLYITYANDVFAFIALSNFSVLPLSTIGSTMQFFSPFFEDILRYDATIFFFLALEEISVFSEPFLFQDTDFLSPSRPSCY